MIDLIRALAAFLEPPTTEHERLAELLGLPGVPSGADHTEVFVLQLYPYASVYLGAEGQLGGDAADRIAGFVRALGGTPPAAPDHLATLLHLYAGLRERCAEAATPTAQQRLLHAGRTLLWEHLLPWSGLYTQRVADIAAPPYPAWASLLDETLRAEAAALGDPPPLLPSHLRDAPSLPDPRVEGTEAFLRGLLAPVRSGIVLTRADLAAAGRALGLGVRVGERAFILRSLASQDAAATLDWIAQRAAAAADRWTVSDTPAPIAAFWQRRATATATLLTELASDARQDAAAATGSSAPGESPGRQKSSISTT